MVLPPAKSETFFKPHRFPFLLHKRHRRFLDAYFASLTLRDASGRRLSTLVTLNSRLCDA
jgi:hypothetical protein